MNKSISCPRCGEPNDLEASNCDHCGVNLGLSAILVEQQLKDQTDFSKELRLSPEVLVPRLGEYLIERKLLSSDDLIEALEYQKKMNLAGQEKLIGQALLDLDLISRARLDQVVTEQILQLQSALREANDELENRVRQRTAELEDALTRLSELSQLKSNFIANISHELRTPLTHLKGYIELLGEGALGDINSQQVDAIKVMQKAESRLGSLIEDLIQFSAYSKGSMEIYLESINIIDVFSNVVPVALQRCKEKGLTCQTKIPDEMPDVMADRQRMPWVLNQLVDNAVKFTPAGGMIQIGAKTNDHQVQLYVFDTGIGIAENLLEEIFEPFHQLDGSSTRRYGGTGLGLSMARQIVEAHDSQFVVRSKEGEGSYFEFSLIVDKNPS
jgi:signal transduction histidine kinase